MANELVTKVGKTVVVNEDVIVKLRELSMTVATKETPGVITLVLGAQDANGEWRNDVQPVIQRKEDVLGSSDPQQRYAASMIHNLIFSALVADTPTHQAMGVVGMTVREAAKVILAAQMGAVVEPTPVEPTPEEPAPVEPATPEPVV